MTDEFDNIPEENEDEFGNAFNEMQSSLDALPEGSFVTLQHEANAPMYIPFFEGEVLTVRGAIERRNLTIGNINAYVDGQVVTLDTPIAAGTVVTLVGNVKGGSL